MKDAKEVMKNVLAGLSSKGGTGDGSKPLLSSASQLLADNRKSDKKGTADERENFPKLFSSDEVPSLPPPPASNIPAVIAAPLLATEADWDTSTQFINTSLRLADMNIPAEDEAAYIANSSWFPTFENLSEQQIKWYVYWRECWKSGRYRTSSGMIPTNEKDILLLAAELINCSYVKCPADSYRLLERLVSDFASVSKNISNYGELWLGDMAWELGLIDEATIHYDRLPQSYGFLSRAVREHKGLEWEPLIFISAYGPSAYFEKHRGELVPLFARALAEADTFVSASPGSHGLLRLLNKGRVIRTSRYAHKPYWALPVYRRIWGEKLWCTVMQNCDRLLQHMGTFLKAVENLHRQSLGEKRLLKVDLKELPQSVNEYLGVLGCQLAEEYKDRKASEGRASKGRKSGKGKAGAQEQEQAQPVVLNPDLAKQLHRDSREVTEIIMASLEEYDDSDAEPAPSLSPCIGQGVPGPAPKRIEDIFRDTVPVTPGDEWQYLADAFNSLERLFLAALKENDGGMPIRQCREWAAARGKMLASLVDGINEKAVETVGEPILCESDQRIEFMDEYREALHSLLEK